MGDECYGNLRPTTRTVRLSARSAVKLRGRRCRGTCGHYDVSAADVAANQRSAWNAIARFDFTPKLVGPRER